MDKVYILNIFLIFVLVLIISLFSVYYFKISKIVTTIEKNLEYGCEPSLTEIPEPQYTDGEDKELFAKKYISYGVNLIYYCEDNNEDINSNIDQNTTEVSKILYDKNDNMFGAFFIHKTANIKFIIYRGSLTNSDWVDIDIDVKQEKYLHYDNACIHSGFYKRFNELKLQLVDILQNYSGEDLYIGGHSLGSPICILTSLFIKQTYKDINNFTYIFALPKMGNQPFAEYVNSQYTEKQLIIYQNDADIIPYLPITSTINVKNKEEPFIYYNFNNKFYRHFYCVRKYVCSNHGVKVYLDNIQNSKVFDNLHYCDDKICNY